jgi:hypothetical protein
MVEDEADKEDPKDSTRTSDTDHKEEKLMIEFTRSEPLASTAMSDIEEESSCSHRDESESPKNSSGIRIIIDEGSSESDDEQSDGPQDCLLEVEDDPLDANNVNDITPDIRRVSHTSEVHLLG